MMIGSGFAMDNNPPTEPVKGIVETEAVEEVPQQSQPKHLGLYAYKDSFDNCIGIPSVDLPAGTMNCTVTITINRCTVDIMGVERDLFVGFYNETTNTWTCGLPLYERTVP